MLDRVVDGIWGLEFHMQIHVIAGIYFCFLLVQDHVSVRSIWLLSSLQGLGERNSGHQENLFKQIHKDRTRRILGQTWNRSKHDFWRFLWLDSLWGQVLTTTCNDCHVPLCSQGLSARDGYDGRPATRDGTDLSIRHSTIQHGSV